MHLLDMSIRLLETLVPSCRRLQIALDGIANQAAARGHSAYRRSHPVHPLVLQSIENQTCHSAIVYANLEPRLPSRFTSSLRLTRDLFNPLLVACRNFKVKLLLAHRKLGSHLVVRGCLDHPSFVQGRRVRDHQSNSPTKNLRGLKHLAMLRGRSSTHRSPYRTREDGSFLVEI